MQKSLLEVPAGVTRAQFEDVINAATAAVNYHHRIALVTEIGKFTSVSNRIIAKILATPEFEKTMLARGYDFSDKAKLTPEQVWAVSIITDPTNRKTLRDKLAQAGITYQQYRAWLNQPIFGRYVKEIGERMLVDHITDVHTRVVERASNGDIQAMRLYYDLIGRTDSTQNKAVADLNATVRLLLEVLVRNIADPATLSRITSEIEQITNGRGAVDTTPAIAAFGFDNIIGGEVIARSDT